MKKENGQIRRILLKDLRVAPWNARVAFDAASLQDLAKSLADHGVLVPLMVRPAPGRDGFEVVCGHSRMRAAAVADMDSVPCEVRELSDAEAQQIGIVDNLQREDLAPMDEAQAYGELLSRLGATIETVAATVAKSPSYVGRRLKLLDAIEPVRTALKAGAIEVAHALELARLSERQQQELLDWLDVGYRAPGDYEGEDGDDHEQPAEVDPGTCCFCYDTADQLEYDGRIWSNAERTICSDADCVRRARAAGLLEGWSATRTTVGDLRDHIARTQLRVLGDVPFPLDDEIPPMACTECPKRAAGAASLFADIAEDTCTDRACLDAKLRLWVKAQLESAESAGRTLAMLYDGNIGDKAGVSRWSCIIDAECANREMAIWVSGARIGHLVQICRDKKRAEHGKDAKGAPSKVKPKQSAEEKRRDEAQEAERAKLAEKVKKESEYRKRLFTAIANVPPKRIDAAAAALLTKYVCLSVLSRSSAYADLLGPELGWDPAIFDYGNEDKLASNVSALTVVAAVNAAVLRLVA